MSTLLEPERNSLMIKSLSFWSMSPCWKNKSESGTWRFVPAAGTGGSQNTAAFTRAETVKSLACIFSVSQSTFLLVLMKITACVMVRVSYKSHSVSSFHSWKQSGRFSLGGAPAGRGQPSTTCLFLHVDVELADTLQGQLLLLYQDSNRFSHELLCDLQDVGRHGGGQKDDLQAHVSLAMRTGSVFRKPLKNRSSPGCCSTASGRSRRFGP